MLENVEFWGGEMGRGHSMEDNEVYQVSRG